MNHAIDRSVRTAALLAAMICLWPASQARAQSAEPDAATQPASQPAAGSEEEERQRLLAAEQSRPTFPGIDPAFIVMPRPAYRSEMANELLTPQVIEMADRALTYLAQNQNPDGSWSDLKFSSNTGVTALCCMAFMSEGSRPRAGKYGKQIDRGFEFILKNVQTNGTLAGKGSNPYGPGYEHAFSTLALLVAYGDMPWRPQAKDVVARAVQLLQRSQRLDGGWRYQMNREGDSDMSVTANVMWVLRMAKKAGFTVSSDMIAQGVKYVEGCAMPDGHFRYRTFGIHASPSLGGTGIIALCNNGRTDHKLIPTARNKIAYEYRRYTIDDLKERRYFVFGAFYASLAMYMCGDQYWIPWFKKAVQVLAAMQRKDGELYDQQDNTMYTTAMAAMVLLAPRGYLPIYER